MLKNVVVVCLTLMLASCGKPGDNYYCECQITYKNNGGTGYYKGADKTKGNAEVDCKERVTMVESNGHTAQCSVKEK